MVYGLDLDTQTRCDHYRSALDIIAIRMRCCDRYYACKNCHDALESHEIETWQTSEREERAVLCGACGNELTIRQYMQCGNVCPNCAAAFNPGCRNHWEFYFEMTPDEVRSS
jgi:uncharacterized CHY-type Zn-finger protein